MMKQCLGAMEALRRGIQAAREVRVASMSRQHLHCVSEGKQNLMDSKVGQSVKLGLESIFKYKLTSYLSTNKQIPPPSK